MSLTRTELGRGAYYDYDPSWMPEEKTKALFDVLIRTLPWEQRPIRVFGQEVMQPRLIAWAGTVPYRYSGQTLPPRPVPEVLAPTLEAISQLCNVPFNHILLNRYRDGHDNMGMHADDERELGRDPIIAALSLGTARRFVLRPKNRRAKHRAQILLENGSLLVMGGNTQHTWRHGVPKQKRMTTERINVTFRFIREDVQTANDPAPIETDL